MSETPSLNPLEPTIDHARPAPGAIPLSDAPGYALFECLGVGGMGEVYRCGDPALGRDLAIKLIKDVYRGHTDFEQRFLREARITGSLQHPGIVPIHNLGRLADGRLHYTMRLVQGRTLAAILREEAGQVEHLPSLLAIFEKVCQAIAYAHSKRVIHRDLKPGNIMIGAFGEVQVMDWGLAKLLTPGEPDCMSVPDAPAGGARELVSTPSEDVRTLPLAPPATAAPSDLTRMGSGMGTPAYMPPEQARGEWDAVEERADVFALGAILCQILTGRPPYADGTLEQAKRGDLTEAFARLEQSGGEAALTALCRGCLSPERGDRPCDAGVVAQRVAEHQAEVRERLRQAELQRATAEATARETAARMAAERRASRWLLGLAAAVLLFVLLGAAGLAAAMLAVRAEQQRTQQALKQVMTEQQNTKEALERATIEEKKTQESLKVEKAARTQMRKALGALTDEVVEELLAKQAVLSDKEKAFIGQVLDYYKPLAAERGADEESRSLAAEGRYRVARLRAFLGENAAAVEDYQAAAKLYEKLTADFPAKAAYRRNLATSYANWGNLLSDVFRKPLEAEPILRQALGLQEKLVEQFPAVPRHRQELARIFSELASVQHRRSKGKESIAFYRKALELIEPLTSEFPKDPHYRVDLALNYDFLAIAQADFGQLAVAEAPHRKSLELRQKLVEEFPTVPLYRQSLASSYNNWGFLLRRLGKKAEAESAYRQAIAVDEKLAADFPSVPRYREDLALHCFNFANMLRVRGQAQNALGWYDKAIALLRPILEQDPRAGRTRLYLCNVHIGQARALDELGRRTESVAAWQQAAKLDNGLNGSFIRMQHAVALARAGQHRAAVRAVEELLTSSAGDAHVTHALALEYNAACVCALSAAAVKDDAPLRERYAARAVTLLLQAKKAGFFKDPKQINNMRKDADLDSLRKRTDFKKFLGEFK